MAFVSDRSGVAAGLGAGSAGWTAAPGDPTMITLSDDPVVAVNWSADGAWLACAVATDGGVRTQVWVVRPDGRDARLIAGGPDQHAELGPWTRSGHRVVVTIPGARAGRADALPTWPIPATGELHAAGRPVS